MPNERIPFRQLVQRFRENRLDVQAGEELLKLLQPLAHACARRLNAKQVLETLNFADEALYQLLIRSDREWDDLDEFLNIAWVVMERFRISDARRRRPDRSGKETIDEPHNEAPDEWTQRLEVILQQVGAIMALKKENPEASKVYRMREFGEAEAPITQGGLRLILDYQGKVMELSEVASQLGIARSTAYLRWDEAIQFLNAQMRKYDSNLGLQEPKDVSQTG